PSSYGCDKCPHHLEQTEKNSCGYAIGSPSSPAAPAESERRSAFRFAREGARVAVVDIDERKGRDAAAEIAAEGEAIFVRADVTDSASVDQMAREVDRRFGRIDILVNNVGVRITKPFIEHTDADWNVMIATNLTGPFFCARAVAPLMIRGGSGRILNVASIASFVGRPDRVAYVSAKSGRLA